jgi:outer membrane protein OmpU
MKKSLLATTAIAAVAAVGVASSAAAEGFETKVSGFMEQWFGYSDNSATAQANADTFVQHTDAEFYVSGKQTLDNGLTFGFQIEVEGEVAGIDEQYGYVEGSFGKIIMGAENVAAYLLHKSIKSAGVGLEEGDGNNAMIAGLGASDMTRTNTHLAAVDDNNSVTYISPAVNGFQFGASFTPTIATDDRVPAGTTAAKRIRTNDGVRDDAWSVGANYSGSLSDMSLAASIGYTDGGSDDTAAGQLQTVTAGVQVGFGGFTISAAMGTENDDAAGQEIKTFGTSIMYAAGPMGVSLGFMSSEDDQNDDKQNQFELGASYKLGAGVTALGSVYAAERKTAGSTTADGVGVVGGIKLDF